MPTIKKRVTLTAGGENANVFTGSAYEYLGQRARVTLAVAKDNTATFAPLIDFQVGPELLLESSPVGVEQTAGGGAILPENILIEDFAAPGDRLVGRLRESGGAAGGDVDVMIRIEFLGA